MLVSLLGRAALLRARFDAALLGHGQRVYRRVQNQFESAEMAPIPRTQPRTLLQLAMPYRDVTRRASPWHKSPPSPALFNWLEDAENLVALLTRPDGETRHGAN